MVMVKDMTQLTLKDLWKEDKDEEEWWGDISERTVHMVKLILQSSLEEELLEFLGASRYQRTELRKGHRNGHYEKSLYTRFGVIKELRVPRARGSYSSKVLLRYQRRQDEANTPFQGILASRKYLLIFVPVSGEQIKITTGGSRSENKKVFEDAGISDSLGG